MRNKNSFLPEVGVFFALFRLFPTRFPRTHQTAQAEQADADAGQQVGQGQHAAGGLKQGLGQLQSGAEQERTRPRRVERMPTGQTRHKKNFDQHHSQQQCGGSAQHPQRAGHTAERRGRKLEPPDEPPQKHQRHSARQQRTAQPLALQAKAAERPHSVVQQPRTGKDRQQQVRPRGPDRAAPGEYLRVQDGIPGRIARRHAGGQQCRTGQRHTDAQRLVGILQTGRLRRRPPRGHKIRIVYSCSNTSFF